MSTLIVRLGESASWALSGSGSLNEGFKPLRQSDKNQLSELATQHPVTCLVPGEAVALQKLQMPAQQIRQAKKALGFVMEDRVVGDIDQLHFVAGKERRDHLPVATVDCIQMTNWLELAAELNLQPASVCPDMLALPWQEGSWSIAIEGERSLLKTNNDSGQVIDTIALADLLKLMLSQPKADEEAEQQPALLSQPTEIIVWGGDQSIVDAIRALLPEAVGFKHSARGWMPATNWIAPLELRQGRFAPQAKIGKLWKQWKVAVIIGAVWSLVWLTGQGFHLLQLQQQQQQLDQQIVDTYRTAFPQSRNVPNPRLQMEQKLKQLRGGVESGDFPLLMSGTSKALVAEKDFKLDRINFDAGRGELRLELQLNDLERVEELRKGIANQGLNVEVKRATRSDTGVDVRIVVRRGS